MDTNTAIVTTQQSTAVTGGLSAMTPDLARQRPLGELVETCITAACGSDGTARLYRRAIGDFVLMLQERHADALNGKPLVERRVGSKRERGKVTWFYHPAPCAVLLAVDNAILDAYRASKPKTAYDAVRTFLAVAYRDNILTTEQATGMGIKPFKARQKRKRQVTGRRLTPMEVQVLRAALGSERVKDIRDKLIIDLALYAGLRRFEIARLRLTDFRTDNGRLYLQFVGKGDFERKIAVHPDLHKSLVAWLETSGKALGDDASLFARVDKSETIQAGSGITPQAVSNLIVALGASSGLAPAKGKGVLSPHDLRRTFARRLYDCGVGIDTIRILLGHADVKTTMLYIGVDADDAKNAVDKLTY